MGETTQLIEQQIQSKLLYQNKKFDIFSDL